MIRPSSYNIFVKLKQPGQYLAVQGCTGAVDEVDEPVYKYLNNRGLGGDEVAPSVIETLSKRGFLTERSVDEEREYMRRIAEIYHRRSSQNVNFVIAPTFSCQMRCTYCYEAHIAHSEDANSLRTMAGEHVATVFETIDKIVADSPKKPDTRITLYGGEPLMAKNLSIVQQIVEEGIKRNYSFATITNGYDLLEFEGLLGPKKLENLQITLDGLKPVHDKRRFAVHGRPTFDRIVEGIQLALDKGCTISLRTNVDANNLNSLDELNRFYIEKGWNKNPDFHSYAFVIKESSPRKLLPMDILASYDNKYAEDKSGKIIQIDFGVSNAFNALLMPRKFPPLRPYYCSSNLGSYIFGPDGRIYTCWEEVGMEKRAIGAYMPEFSLNDERYREWRERSVDKIPECLDCAYALLCGGGCGRAAFETTGSLKTPFCHQFPEVFHHIVPALYENYLKKRQEGTLNEIQVKEKAACD